MSNQYDSAYVLASASPRRKQLLAYLNLPQTFQFAVDTDETIPSYWTPDEAVMKLSIKKAVAVLERFPILEHAWSSDTKAVSIIAADTIVVRDEHILGKPKDKTDAFTMLKSLQGRNHEVYTGLTLLTSSQHEIINKQDEARIIAKQLEENTIDFDRTCPINFGQIGKFYDLSPYTEDELKLYTGYIKSKVTFRPLTDAQIEEYVNTGDPLDKAGSYGIQGIGAVNIESIDGDFYSVMGLPVSLLHHLISLAKT